MVVQAAWRLWDFRF